MHRTTDNAAASRIRRLCPDAAATQNGRMTTGSGGGAEATAAAEETGADVAPRAGGEWARHWRHAQLPGLDLLRARYVRHAFPRHAHEGYVIAAVTHGVEEVGFAHGSVRTGPGEVMMINPEIAHTARAGAPEGWAYATLYPSAALVTEVAGETTALRGTAGFAETVTEDPHLARMITEIHRAAEAGQALAADTLLRAALARLLRRYGGPLPTRAPRGAGTPPAEAAVAVGFTDQPHLNRHFTRIVGVPPGAYRRERADGRRRNNVQDPEDAAP